MLAAIHRAVWGIPMLALMTGSGIFLTVCLGFFQFTHFGSALRNALGGRQNKASGQKGMTSMQATATALAGTIGTGNIVGVTGAVSLGGPGAVFWMEAAALLGMAVKFSEIALAIRFREKDSRGEWIGGPMYYIKNGLGPAFEPLGGLFAALGALAAFGSGNLVQVHSIAASINAAANHLIPGGVSCPEGLSLCAGMATAVFCALSYLGGARRVGAVAEKLVPVMALVYVSAGLGVIIINRSRILPALGAILAGAFRPSAVLGGAVGITFRQTVTQGISRGVFSNEAGLGSAPIAHATADTEGPVQEGMMGIFEVFADTIILCTITALVILTSGVSIPYGSPAGIEVPAAAFASVFGPWASVVEAVSMLFFALSTVLSWGLYGARCARYLFGPWIVRPYETAFCLSCVLGAVMDLSSVWDLAETLNALMTAPNLIALLALSPFTIRMVRNYRASQHTARLRLRYLKIKRPQKNRILKKRRKENLI